MSQMDGERMIMEAHAGILRLTTHRVRLEYKATDHSKLVSITLDAVASCGLVTKTYPLLLGLAILAALIGLFQFGSAQGVGIFLLVVAMVLVGVYLASRSAVLEIGSAAHRIVVSARTDREELIGFIDAVEAAKVQYMATQAPPTMARAFG